MERVMGIEPTTSAWKAEVLPLNYTRAVIKITLFFIHEPIMLVAMPVNSVKPKVLATRSVFGRCVAVAEVLPLN